MLYNGIDSTLRVDYKAEFVVKIFFITFVITFKCNDYSCNNYSWVTKLFLRFIFPRFGYFTNRINACQHKGSGSRAEETKGGGLIEYVCTYGRGHNNLRPLLTCLGLLPHAAPTVGTHHIDIIHLTKLLGFMVYLHEKFNKIIIK